MSDDISPKVLEDMLAEVGSEHIIEVLRRRGLAVSVWSKDDLQFLVDESDALAEIDEETISDEELEAIMQEEFERVVSEGLIDHLGQKGNEFIGMKVSQEHIDDRINELLATKTEPEAN